MFWENKDPVTESNVSLLWSKLLSIYLNHYIINDTLYESKLFTQSAFSVKWYYNIFNIGILSQYKTFISIPMCFIFYIWSELRSEVVLIRHLCVRSYERAVFVCEINQLQVQQMLGQTGSGHHLCLTWVRPKRWHWKWTARAISQLAFKALCPGLSRTGCLLCSQMVASDCAQK